MPLELYRASQKGYGGKRVVFFEVQNDIFEAAKKHRLYYAKYSARRKVLSAVLEVFDKQFRTEAVLTYTSFNYRPATASEKRDYYGLDENYTNPQNNVFVGACDKDWCNACRKGEYEKCPNR